MLSWGTHLKIIYNLGLREEEEIDQKRGTGGGRKGKREDEETG